jgi:hypothetical protein
MNCAEAEILLCDYVDDTLRGTQRSAFEEHLRDCPACNQLAQDVTGAVEFMDRAAVVDPPAELMTRILHLTPVVRPSWWRRGFLGRFDSILQPRYAMGMAMTILSFSMIARFSPIQVRQLKPSDLDPVKIWVSVDDRVHRTWDRAVKYYENLRWVIEVQSRVNEWSEQEQELRKQNPAAQKQKNGKQ